MSEYSEVYHKQTISEGANENEIEIDVEYVYLTIPKDYVCVYHKLLNYLADFGEQAIKDCEATCKAPNMYVIQCWNMFQSALACHTLGQDDKANLFINYINAQLDNIYKGTNKEIYCGGGVLPITDDGKLFARVSCEQNEVKFYVDGETGMLYQKYLKDKELDKVYEISEVDDSDQLVEIEN